MNEFGNPLARLIKRKWQRFQINKIQITDEDSGDNSIDMEDYVIKTNIELKNLKEIKK